MTSGFGEDTFINHLMEETFSSMESKEGSEEVSSPEDLQQYFDKAESDVELVGDWVPLHYVAETGCFRLVQDEMILDFPSNWSFFQALKDSLETNREFTCAVSADEELWEVLKSDVFRDEFVSLASREGTPYFVKFSKEIQYLDFLSKGEGVSEDQDLPDLPPEFPKAA